MTVDHVVRVCLDAPLYLKFIQFQAQNNLGRSYAMLLIVVEGMHTLGLIDDDAYGFYKQRYSKPLQALPIKREEPKCCFCGRKAVALAVHQGGITKNVCEKHVKEFLNHEKWHVIKQQS